MTQLATIGKGSLPLPPPPKPPTLRSFGMPSLGCDPEFFFQDEKGQVVGAERILPTPSPKVEAGLKLFVLDGVQVEMHPKAATCRAHVANHVAVGFRSLKKHLATLEGVSACFSTTVKLKKKELASLSPAARTFGCVPSLSAYPLKLTGKAPVDAATYLKRSAGGHVHIGLKDSNCIKDASKWPELVPVLDILLGNTCVMLDRDPGAVERRKHYGRAGEFRLPPHGLEYRTLSNFWLRSYPLMSMVFGITRMGINVVANTYNPEILQNNYSLPRLPNGRPQQTPTFSPWDAIGELKGLVDLKKVVKAINTNDPDLAWENWQGVKEFVKLHIPKGGELDVHSLWPNMLEGMDYFLQSVMKDGLEPWFPEDPLTYWSTIFTEGHGGNGWESFANQLARKRWAQAKRVAHGGGYLD